MATANNDPKDGTPKNGEGTIKETDDEEAFAASLETMKYGELQEADADDCSDHPSSAAASDFVAAVAELHKTLPIEEKVPYELVRLVAGGVGGSNDEDVVQMTERMLGSREAFRAADEPTRVDVGYHYTKRKRMEQIQANGLLSKPDRDALKIDVQHHGSVYGEGVYTGNDPYAFKNDLYGETCLMVARLRGSERTVKINDTDHDGKTSVANSGTSRETVILKTSCQVVPLLYFHCGALSHPYYLNAEENEWHMGHYLVHRYHVELQKLIDERFNGGKPTPVPPFPEPEQWLNAASQQHVAQPNNSTASQGNPPHANAGGNARPAVAATQNGRSRGGILAAAVGKHLSSMWVRPKPAPPKLGNILQSPDDETLRYDAPETLSDQDDYSSKIEVVSTPPACVGVECSICLNAFRNAGAVARLRLCGHVFHSDCIKDALGHGKKCPVCRKLIGVPQGKMPSGYMSVSQTVSRCQGYRDCGTIVLWYTIPGGIQKVYHENPGQHYHATTRQAFLPDNADGKKLCGRLKYAFAHGLTFTVGTSLTTGKRNSVTWSSVHHKTSQNAGPHGYPDPGYFLNCNEELDALGVPAAEDCESEN